jgi:hypothetical protein
VGIAPPHRSLNVVNQSPILDEHESRTPAPQIHGPTVGPVRYRLLCFFHLALSLSLTTLHGDCIYTVKRELPRPFYYPTII